MKTFIIDLNAINVDIYRTLIGYVNTNGLNFRKIEQINGFSRGDTLVIEFSNKGEETALKAFLKEQGIANPIVIGNGNKATLDGKKLGIFSQVSSVLESSNYWQDKSTGKKFAIIQGEI